MFDCGVFLFCVFLQDGGILIRVGSLLTSCGGVEDL